MITAQQVAQRAQALLERSTPEALGPNVWALLQQLALVETKNNLPRVDDEASMIERANDPRI